MKKSIIFGISGSVISLPVYGRQFVRGQGCDPL